MKKFYLTCALVLAAAVGLTAVEISQQPLAKVVELQPRKITEPTIRWWTAKDGYLIENPLDKGVLVQLNCGTDYELVDVEMLPKSKVLIEVLDKDGTPVGICIIANYTPLKPKKPAKK